MRIPVDATTVVSGVLAVSDPAAGGPLAHVALVLGHGAGADMTNAFLSAVHEGLAARGAVVLKFNFAYTEAGRKAPDPPARLLATYRAVAEWLAARPEADGRRLVLGGKSMGGRIASHLAALDDPGDPGEPGAPIAGLLFLGYPLHPAGQPTKLRDAHLGRISAPMLFIEGTRDPLCDLALLAPVLTRLGPRATLAVIADGDHSFHVRKSSGRDDAAATAEVIAAGVEWLARLKAPRPPRAAGGARSRPAAKSPAPSSSSGRGGTRTARSARGPRR